MLYAIKYQYNGHRDPWPWCVRLLVVFLKVDKHKGKVCAHVGWMGSFFWALSIFLLFSPYFSLVVFHISPLIFSLIFFYIFSTCPPGNCPLLRTSLSNLASLSCSQVSGGRVDMAGPGTRLPSQRRSWVYGDSESLGVEMSFVLFGGGGMGYP